MSPEELMPSCDIVFLSYRESRAEDNWSLLKARFPNAKRVHGVKGILQAHQKAAEVSESEFFFLVDGDNRIREDFHFEARAPLDKNTIYVYRCHNPANSLEYGYGAVKIYNKKLIENKIKKSFIDLATTVATNYKIIYQVASETHFFYTPEEAWRGAFRETAKLARQSLKSHDSDSFKRLEQWCSEINPVPNKEWVLQGATEGRKFGSNEANSLPLINNFDWLKECFLKSIQSHPHLKGTLPTPELE